MDIRMIGVEQLARLGQEDLRGSAGRYRQGRPSRIIGLLARIAGAACRQRLAVKQRATPSTAGSDAGAPQGRVTAR